MNLFFKWIINKFGHGLTVIDNPDTLGFVRYVLIPWKFPIIINWNIGSKVSDQVCENNIIKRKNKHF